MARVDLDGDLGLSVQRKALAQQRDVDQQLCNAVGRGDLHAMAAAVRQQNARINRSLGPEQLAPLHLACTFTRAGPLGALLKLGADLAQKDASGRTAMHTACKGGWAEGVRMLADAGASINAVDDLGATPVQTFLAVVTTTWLLLGIDQIAIEVEQPLDVLPLHVFAVNMAKDVRTVLETWATMPSLPAAGDDDSLLAFAFDKPLHCAAATALKYKVTLTCDGTTRTTGTVCCGKPLSHARSRTGSTSSWPLENLQRAA